MTAGRTSLTKNKEWYTPSEFMEAVYLVLGVVDLDPCGAFHKDLSWVYGTGCAEPRWSWKYKRP